MVRRILFLLCFALVACASDASPYTLGQQAKGYREFITSADRDSDTYNQDMERTIENLQKSEHLWSTTGSILDGVYHSEYKYDMKPADRYDISSMDKNLSVGNDRYAIKIQPDFSGPVHEDDNCPGPQRYTMTKNGKEIATFDSRYVTDGPIAHTSVINGEPALTIIQDNCNHHYILNVLYQGKTFNEKYVLPFSSFAFSYKGHIGFVTRLPDNKFYMYFDGQIVSKSFDVIVTTTCCMAPQPIIRVYNDGTLVFAGERDGKVIVTAIDLNRHL